MLNGFLRTNCYTWRLAHPSTTTIIDAFLCSRWRLTQRPQTSQDAESKRLWNAQLQMGHLYYTPTARAREEGTERVGTSLRPWRTTRKTVCFPWAIVRMQSMWLKRQYVQDLRKLRLDEIPAWTQLTVAGNQSVSLRWWPMVVDGLTAFQWKATHPRVYE